MRRSRSQLNNLASSQEQHTQPPASHMPIGSNRQTDEIQRRLHAMGVQHQPMQQEVYAPPPQMTQRPAADPYAAYPQQMAMPYADYPAPPSPVDDQRLDHIRASLEQMGTKIGALAQQSNANAQNPHTQALIKQNEQITSELLEMRKALAQSSRQTDNSADLRAEMEAIRQALEANYKSISQQIDASPTQDGSENVARAIEASHDRLAQDVQTIHSALNNVSDNSNIFSKTIEARQDEVASRITHLQESVNAALNNPEFYLETVETSHRELLAHFADLRDAVAAMEHANHHVAGPDLTSIEMRLEEITRAVVALSAGDYGTDSLDRIEARIADLARSFSEYQPQSDDEVLRRLGNLSNEVALLGTKDDTETLKFIDGRIKDLSSQIGTLSPTQNTKILSRLESELVSLKSDLSSLPAPEVNVDTSAFERQMREVRNTLKELNDNVSSATNMPEIGFAGIADQINKLSEKLDNRAVVENGSENADAANSVDHSALVKRLDQLVDQVSRFKSNPIDLTPIQGMIKQSVSNNVGGRLEDVASKLDDLYERGFQSSDIPDYSDAISSLGEQLSDITGQLKNTSNVPLEKLSLGPIEERLAGIEQHLNARLDGADDMPRAISFEPLEERLAGIEEQLNANRELGNSPLEPVSFAPIEERLAGIEEQLSASRDIAIEVATQAAEEAVDRTIKEMPASEAASPEIDASAINALTDDLRSWQQDLANSNEENFETFDAVRDTLTRMAERLAGIEQLIQTAPVREETQFAPQPIAEPEPAQPASNMVAPEYEEEPQQPEFGSAEDHLEHVAQSFRDDVDEIAAGSVPEEPAAPVSEPSPVEDVEASAIAEIEQRDPEIEEGMNPLFAAAVSEANKQQIEEPAAIITPEIEYQAPQEHVAEPAIAVDTPGVDLEELRDEDEILEEDIPLEPGTGTPDLASLVRQANERRKSGAKNGNGSSSNDFLASARRAAQAAAAEADLVKKEIDETEKNGFAASLPGMIAKRKKVLMAGAAVIVIVVLALPLAFQFIGGGLGITQSEAPASIEQSSTQEENGSLLASEPLVGDEQSALPQTEPEAVNSITPVTDPVSLTSQRDVRQVGETPTSAFDAENKILAGSGIEVVEDAAVGTYDLSKVNFTTDALKRAAESSDAAALFEIARRYSDGIGTEKNLQEAAIWYERSAELGFAPAQYIIGNFNEKGIGIERNYEKAVSWYELAASGGNVVAMHNLGVLYATPNAVAPQPDMKKAFQWFGQAAEHGVRDSQVNMGIFHTKGIGTEVNLVEAYKWFAVASASGDKDAETKLTVIEDALRPDQLQAAKAIVENWKPSKLVAAANDVKIPDAWKPASQNANAAPVSKKTIAQMQAVLTRLGYNAGPPDGIMGDKTRKAIADYRRSVGLKVNETVDAELLKSLTKAISG